MDYQLEEKDLINRIISGKTELFKYIIDDYSNMVFSLCINILKNSEDAKDASQDTFYRVFKSLKKFDGNKSKLSTWIYKIAYNKCIDLVRKKNNFLNFKSYFKTKNNNYEFQKHYFESEIVAKLLSELSEKDSGLITLYYLNELSINEISTITQETESNIKVKLHRIRLRLKKIAQNKYKSELDQE